MLCSVSLFAGLRCDCNRSVLTTWPSSTKRPHDEVRCGDARKSAFISMNASGLDGLSRSALVCGQVYAWFFFGGKENVERNENLAFSDRFGSKLRRSPSAGRPNEDRSCLVAENVRRLDDHGAKPRAERCALMKGVRARSGRSARPRPTTGTPRPAR